jgi:hypothetical protein
VRAVERRLFDHAQLAAQFAVRAGLQQELRAAEDGGEDVVEVVRDAAGHFTERVELGRLHQLRLGLPQLVERHLHVGVQPRVGDGRAALPGEQRGQLEVFGLETARPDARERDDAHHAVARQERHAQKSRLLGRRSRHGHGARVGLGVVHDFAAAGLRHHARDALAQLEAHGHHLFHVRARVAHDGHQHLFLFVEQEHAALVGLDHLADQLGDRAENGVQVERVDHRVAHLEQRGELLLLPLLALEHVGQGRLGDGLRRVGGDRHEPAGGAPARRERHPRHHQVALGAAAHAHPAQQQRAGPELLALRAFAAAVVAAVHEQVLQSHALQDFGTLTGEFAEGAVRRRDARTGIREHHGRRNELQDGAQIGGPRSPVAARQPAALRADERDERLTHRGSRHAEA